MNEKLQALSGGGGGAKPPGWLDGRARRREYWLWVTPALIVGMGLAAFKVPGASLIMGVPILFMWIRRLHDLGHSGWTAPFINVASNVLGFAAIGLIGGAAGGLIAMVIYLGVIVAMGAIPGQPHSNKYGPAPGKKAVAEVFT